MYFCLQYLSPTSTLLLFGLNQRKKNQNYFFTHFLYKLFKTSDKGDYFCQISDGYGNANFSESFQVQVGSPPDYVDFDIKAEKLIFYPDSDPINLTCVAKDHEEQNNIEQYFLTITGRDSRA